MVSTSAASVTTTAATISIANRLLNISSRAAIGTGENLCITGFIVNGDVSLSKEVLVRPVGLDWRSLECLVF